MDTDGATGLVSGIVGGGLGTWIIQRIVTKVMDGGDKVELLGPKLDRISEDLRDVKKSIEKIDDSVNSHDKDIDLMKADLRRLQTEKSESHVQIWKRLDELMAKLDALSTKPGRRR